jgi:hypothetical protein
MALSREEMKEISRDISKIIDLLDNGTTTADELLDRAAQLPPHQARACQLWIKFAVAIRKAPPMKVKEPRYRKGTGRRPAAWSDCHWQPPQ